MLFEKGDVSEYISDYIYRDIIIIKKQTELSEKEFQEKLTKNLGESLSLIKHKNYGLSVWDSNGKLFYNKGFIVISENEILYIHDSTLWSYIFEVKE